MVMKSTYSESTSNRVQASSATKVYRLLVCNEISHRAPENSLFPYRNKGMDPQALGTGP